jgi:hypothetical protein
VGRFVSESAVSPVMFGLTYLMSDRSFASWHELVAHLGRIREPAELEEVPVLPEIIESGNRALDRIKVVLIPSAQYQRFS